MGILERKEREREEMRNLIVNTAFEVFVKEGYSGTSLRLIAKKMEYSPGTIYLYYKDKDDLFFDIQQRCFHMLIAQYQETDQISDPLERLRQIGIIYMDFNTRNPQCFSLMFMMEGPLSELRKSDRWEKYGNVAGFFRYTVAECIDKGLIKYTNIAEAAIEIWSVAHGLTTICVKKSYAVMDIPEESFKTYMHTCWKNFIDRITQ